jgi:hypothetical protein
MSPEKPYADDEIRLPPTNAVNPARALVALARKVAAGETRSVYIAVVHADGKPDHALYLYPPAADRDMGALIDRMVDAVDNAAKARKKGLHTI